MSTKPTGLAQFTANHKGGAAGAVPVAAAVTASVAPPVVQVAAPEAPRQRGKSDQVALTVRLPRGEWERLHQLAVAEGTSIQRLAVKGLSKVFEEKGLSWMAEQIDVR